MTKLYPALRAAAVASGFLWALAIAPASAQVGLPGGQGNAPIEITADNLEVRQQENLAIFSGNVDAVQGDMSLRADELRVHYVQGGNNAGQGIQSIEANGNVVVVSKDQSASGDRGTYDPTQNRVTLEGNVVLTQANNVIRGGRLDFNTASGVATLTPPPAAEGKRERVKALFKPEARTGNGKPEARTTPRSGS